MSKDWKVIDFGEVPEDTSNHTSYACPGCLMESMLPVKGVAIAQVGSALVFDVGKYAMPKIIMCRYCRKKFEVA